MIGLKVDHGNVQSHSRRKGAEDDGSKIRGEAFHDQKGLGVMIKASDLDITTIPAIPLSNPAGSL